MLSPDSRAVVMDLLKPPANYRLDKAALMTYSLDLEVLLALPLAVLAQTDVDLEQLLQDPLLLLEAIREAGERIHVFVDEGGIAVPGNSRALYGALEASVHPVKAPNGGAFHPKVWIAKFLAEGQLPLIRVSVASRNLTFDRCWDIALTSQASPGKKMQKDSKPLANLVRRLPELGTEPLSDSVVSTVQALADEVECSAFPAPEGFSGNVRFDVLGLGRPGKLWMPVEQARRVLAIAPFVTPGALHHIAWLATHESLLVSRAEELSRLSEDLSEDWGSVRVLSQTAEGEHEDGAEARPSGLHAKLMVFEQGHQATWFIGSANLTDAALRGSNVEAMASVSGPKGRPGSSSGAGIDPFLDSGFGGLCEDFKAQELAPESDADRQAVKKMETARKALLSAPLRVVCCEAGQEWRLAIEGDVSIPEDVTVTVWPLSVEGHQYKTWQDGVNWLLPIARLTAFVAFKLAIVGYSEELRFTIKLPVTGMPDSRIHHVLRTLIDSPERFLQFLRALLGGMDEIAGLIGDKSGQAWNFSSSQGLGGEPLLEDMLRALSRDPKRLEPVRRLIADLRESEEGRRIVPDDLYALWQVVESVLAEKENI